MRLTKFQVGSTKTYNSLWIFNFFILYIVKGANFRTLKQECVHCLAIPGLYNVDNLKTFKNEENAGNMALFEDFSSRVDVDRAGLLIYLCIYPSCQYSATG